MITILGEGYSCDKIGEYQKILRDNGIAHEVSIDNTTLSVHARLTAEEEATITNLLNI